MIFARVFVFARPVLGDNKGVIPRVFSIVLVMYGHIFDVIVFLQLFSVFNVRDALFNAFMAS